MEILRYLSAVIFYLLVNYTLRRNIIICHPESFYVELKESDKLYFKNRSYQVSKIQNNFYFMSSELYLCYSNT